MGGVCAEDQWQSAGDGSEIRAEFVVAAAQILDQRVPASGSTASTIHWSMRLMRVFRTLRATKSTCYSPRGPVVAAAASPGAQPGVATSTNGYSLCLLTSRCAGWTPTRATGRSRHARCGSGAGRSTDRRDRSHVRWTAVEAVQRIAATCRLGRRRNHIVARRGPNIGIVAAARALIELVFHGPPDHHIHCLNRLTHTAPQPA